MRIKFFCLISIALLFILICCSMLGGCSVQGIADSMATFVYEHLPKDLEREIASVPAGVTKDLTEEVLSYEFEGVPWENEEYVVESQDLEDIVIPPEEQEMSEEESSLTSLMEDEKNYCYSLLEVSDKRVYIQIFNSLLQMGQDTVLSSTDTAQIEKCFNFCMMDHPELFFVDGYRTKLTTSGGIPIRLEFTGRFTCTAEERKEKQDEIDEYVSACLSEAPKTDDYAKVKYIFDYLIDKTDYDLEAPDNQNISSVFITRKSVCQGYSMATKYLLDKLGVFCTVVYGEAEGVSHAWNLVRMNGTYCYVDTTWGDASYKSSDTGEVRDNTNYNYLGCNEEILKRTHKIDSPAALPECTALTEYFFVKEGLYFESPDMERLKKLFGEKRQQGAEFFTIRCANDQVYDTFDLELFEKQGIFSLLGNELHANFIRDREEDSITFFI